LRGGFLPLLTTSGGDGFFRPIGYVSLALTSQWAGSSPVLWHATALAIHAANVVLVFTLALVLGRSRRAAIFGAALFAIHGTRPEVVVWVAGRFDLLSTFFLVLGLLLFIRSQAGDTSIGYTYAASLVCMILAILTKESAFVFPVLLAVLVFSVGAFSWPRIGGLIPFFYTAAVVFLYRWTLVGGIGGYRDVLTGKPQIFTLSMVHALEALLLRVWAVLFFPINWSQDLGQPVAVLMIAYILAIVSLAFVGVRRAEIVFPLAFVLITALPALHLLLIGPDLGKSRLLYLPSIGFSLLLACAADALKYPFRWAVPIVILAFHFFAVQHNLSLWQYASLRARSAIVAAAGCIGPGTENVMVLGLPQALRGVPFFAHGFSEAFAFERQLHPEPAAVRFNGSASGGTHQPCVLAWDDAKDELRAVR
jgi:protein O-mannosyl-transferase